MTEETKKMQELANQLMPPAGYPNKKKKQSKKK